ncbi:MAG: elongation factor G [Acetobacteraceae bacterium]|nr:elongation factor G [Acetobacteraceae bacterium]
MSDPSQSAKSSGPRVVALLGPYGSGKSALFEAMLAAAGAPLRRPGDPRSRSMSTEMRIGQCTFLDESWTLLDAPGSVEFAYEAEWAARVADLVVVVCEPVASRAATAGPVLRMLEQQRIPHMLFINKMDALAGSVRDLLAALQAFSSAPLVLRQVPIRDGEAVSGYVDLVSERAYRYRKGQPSELIRLPEDVAPREQEARAALIETLADHDDALLEKVLDDVAPTPAELYAQLHADLADNRLTEVLLGSAENGNGIRRLWKTLRHDAPPVGETAAARHALDPDGEPILQVFKTVHAGHGGKLSFARIWRGAVRDGASLGGTRIGGLQRSVGGELGRVAGAEAGDVVALGRMDEVATGATLSPSGRAEALDGPARPAPVYALAAATEDRKDDVKLSGALRRLEEEDPSLMVRQDMETGETVLEGQGEMHLQAAIARLAAAHHLALRAVRPRVACKETIRRSVRQHARLKRQTGGHGQFADVTIEIAPRPRGEGFQFTDRVVGGAVPRQYIPAVGEAAEEAARSGPFGYPVVDLSVTLLDGGFHSVDSSDMAFRTATRQAMTEALAKADPVVLEPIERVTVSVPNDSTARAQRLLTGRRGQILGYAEREGWPGWDDVQALVPRAEMHDLIIELRSQTMGLGSFRHSFDHLAESRTGKLERGAA